MINNFKQSLTDKQRLALELALVRGYYNIPKDKALLDNLAKEFGVSRATYREHLRKAENKWSKVLIEILSANEDTIKDKLPKQLMARKPRRKRKWWEW